MISSKYFTKLIINTYKMLKHKIEEFTINLSKFFNIIWMKLLD